MIDKVNVSSGWHDRLFNAGLKTKSKIGHHFKKNVHDAIYDMKDCTFQPQIRAKKRKGRLNVFKNSDRLYKEAEKRQKWERGIQKKYKKTHFKPRVNEYDPQEFYEAQHKPDKLGLTNDSRYTKYYYESDFSPMRYHRDPQSMGFGVRTIHFHQPWPKKQKSLFTAPTLSEISTRRKSQALQKNIVIPEFTSEKSENTEYRNDEQNGKGKGGNGGKNSSKQKDGYQPPINIFNTEELNKEVKRLQKKLDDNPDMSEPERNAIIQLINEYQLQDQENHLRMMREKRQSKESSSDIFSSKSRTPGSRFKSPKSRNSRYSSRITPKSTSNLRTKSVTPSGEKSKRKKRKKRKKKKKSALKKSGRPSVSKENKVMTFNLDEIEQIEKERKRKPKDKPKEETLKSTREFKIDPVTHGLTHEQIRAKEQKEAEKNSAFPFLQQIQLLNTDTSKWTDIRVLENTPRGNVMNAIIRDGREHYIINMLTQNASIFPKYDLPTASRKSRRSKRSTKRSNNESSFISEVNTEQDSLKKTKKNKAKYQKESISHRETKKVEEVEVEIENEMGIDFNNYLGLVHTNAIVK